MHPVFEKLGKETVLFDGGMGTQLQARGLKGGELPEMWNLEHPEIVEELQRAYVEAGCDILKTNTFGGNALKQKRSGHAVSEIVSAAISFFPLLQEIKVTTQYIPAEGTYHATFVRGMSVLIPDFEANRKILQDTLK